jgi:septal ring factor EnvC (AmiA/AmiB activator)
MSEIESDDPRLRATEEQMRRALGLRQGSSPSGQVASSVPHPQRRQFVRDGQVPVEVLHGPDNRSRVNQLAATREALQAQTTAREEAERMLAEARHTIHDLQTKLGHERLARDEAVQHVESAKREVEQELAAARQELEAERSLRTTTARERDQTVIGRQAAEDRLRQMKDARKAVRRVKAMAPAEPPAAAPQPRRRGRPPKVPRDDTAVVEWWTPGWKDKYR